MTNHPSPIACQRARGVKRNQPLVFWLIHRSKARKRCSCSRSQSMSLMLHHEETSAIMNTFRVGHAWSMLHRPLVLTIRTSPCVAPRHLAHIESACPYRGSLVRRAAPDAPTARGAHFPHVTFPYTGRSGPILHVACLSAWQMHASRGSSEGRRPEAF